MAISTLSSPVFKPLPIASSSIIRTPSVFSAKYRNPCLSIPPRFIKPHLSSSYTSTSLPSLFPKKNTTISSSVVSLVAQVSDWAQQEEDTPSLEGEWHEFGSPEADLEQKVTWDSEEEGNVDSEEETSEEVKLFVGNLPYHIDAEALAGIFQQAGIVEAADVIYTRETMQSRGFGFVTMSVEDAEKAVEMFHRYDLDGRLLTVNKAAPRGTQPVRPPHVSDPDLRIYVGNLSWSADKSQLEQVFSKHGKVADARIVYDIETNRSRGFGFVTMCSETEANDAIAALDGQSLDGRQIRVSKAERRRSPGF